MKKKSKVISLLLATTFILTAFAGCSSEETAKENGSEEMVTENGSEEMVEEAGEQTQAKEESVGLEGLTEKGTVEDDILVMGTNAAFPPFEFVADNEQGISGKFDGVDVAIGMKIAESMGMELQVVDMPFESLIMALDSGKIDFIAAGMTATPERDENVDFSEKYYQASQLIIVPKDNTDITSAADLDGKLIGVQLSTTADIICTEQLPNATINKYNRGIEAVIDLKNGKLDAVVIDSGPAKLFVENDPDLLKTIEDPEFFGKEEYAMAVKEGNTVLLEQMNSVILEMKASGEIDALVEKYSK